MKEPEIWAPQHICSVALGALARIYMTEVWGGGVITGLICISTMPCSVPLMPQWLTKPLQPTLEPGPLYPMETLEVLGLKPAPWHQVILRAGLL